jgi:hypothetical protein
MYFIFDFFIVQFATRNKETTPPSTFRPGCVSSPISLRPLMPTIGWLLFPPIRWWPSKPNAPSLSLFSFFSRSI